jgi:prolipoprotein diacylglyceryl transferase
MLFGYFYWDPDRALFNIDLPFLERPILWYGFLFAMGFFIAYWLLVYLLRNYFLHHCQGDRLAIMQPGKEARDVAEKLTLYAIVGTIIGARLGDVLFYQDWAALMRDPLSAIRIWEGGLASHGGAIGILIGIIYAGRALRQTYPFLSWIRILDLIALPTLLAASCIRVGNFINQEILGKSTTLPWAVVFGHPADGSAALPRHPVQLYEACAYLLIFSILIAGWKRGICREGKMSGLFLIATFLARFLLEFLKEEQSVYLTAESLLSMGQILSIPFLLLGGWLFFQSRDQSFDPVGIKRG